jgi:hypothetical protein
MHSLINAELATARRRDVEDRQGGAAHQRGHPPAALERPPRLRGAVAAVLARAAVRLDAERAGRTLA